jgi:hypothetical protein
MSVSRYRLAVPTGSRGRKILCGICGSGRSGRFATVFFADKAKIALFDLGAAPIGMMEDDAF